MDEEKNNSENNKNDAQKKRRLNWLNLIGTGILVAGGIYFAADNYSKREKINVLQDSLANCYKTNYDSTKIDSTSYSPVTDSLKVIQKDSLDSVQYKPKKSKTEKKIKTEIKIEETQTKKYSEKAITKTERKEEFSDSRLERLSLREMPDTLVYLKTQEEYNQWSKLAEESNWNFDMWNSRGEKIKPTELNIFDKDNGTYIFMEKVFSQKKPWDFKKAESIEEVGKRDPCTKLKAYGVISLEESIKFSK